MVSFKTTNINGNEGVFNLKTGQFIPKCCMECGRLRASTLKTRQVVAYCNGCVFMPVKSGTCKRQIKDQLLLNFYNDNRLII